MQNVGPARCVSAGAGRAKGTKKANKGARGMPVALGGEEGRDKLRKAAVWLSEAMKDVISCEKPR